MLRHDPNATFDPYATFEISVRMSAPKEIEGRWWLPSVPQNVVQGTLKISPGHSIELTTKRFGVFNSTEILPISHHYAAHNVMLGADKTNQPITLLQCVETRYSMAEGLKTNTYHCAHALLGQHIDSEEKVQLAEVAADFSHLKGWLSISSIRQVEHGDDGIGVVIKMPTELSYPLADGSQLSIRGSMETSDGGYGENCWELREKQVLALRLVAALNITETIELLTRFRWFLSLMMNHPVHLTSLTTTILDETKVRRVVEILGDQIGKETAERPPLPSEMLLTFDDVRDQFAAFVDQWFKYFTRIQPVFDLYFTVIFNRQLYINHQFLFLAQAIEVYHRLMFKSEVMPKSEFRSTVRQIIKGQPLSTAKWLKQQLAYANEKRLATRLEEILNAHAEDAHHFIDDLPTFAKAVRHTRNYYTHFNPELLTRNKAADHSGLFLIAHRLQRLLELCFLKDLGLPRAAVMKVVKRPIPPEVRFQ